MLCWSTRRPALSFSPALCVMFTASAYIARVYTRRRENCVAAETTEASRHALAQMRETLKGTTCPSTALHLQELAALRAS
jgi:hypothetical protein